MKAVLIGINAKYIHPNLAIRLLKSNTNYDCDFIEFNIKDNYLDIYNQIKGYDILCFSTYIWNIEIIKKILIELIPLNKTIILGGPEVSYNAKYYLDNKLCNYVIKNEGEECFDMLLGHIINNNYSLDEIPNLYYDNKFTFDKFVDLDKLNFAYDLLTDLENQITYVETSRGCPYKCGYCMASLEKRVRTFNIDKVKIEIKKLINRGARIIKFLDRTFNANKKNFLSLIDFIIENHKPNNSFQFEITGDLLDPDIIEYINNRSPKGLFRFEIGIQSTNIKANLAVGRIQDNVKLFNNIRLIQDKNIIDLHLDLIAGLPYEDYDSFINTFNEVVSLRPKELQLGFLKLLYGTKMHSDKDLYHYKYMDYAPYEIISNDFLSEVDINNVHITEDAFEKYYNSTYYKKSINLILDNIDNPYNFFYQLGLIYKDNKVKRLEDSFKLLDDFIKDLFNNNIYKTIHEVLIIEYLNIFKVKPTIWWNKLDTHNRNIILRNLKERFIINYNIDTLYKYSTVVEFDKSYLIAIYKDNSLDLLRFDK